MLNKLKMGGILVGLIGFLFPLFFLIWSEFNLNAKTVCLLSLSIISLLISVSISILEIIEKRNSNLIEDFNSFLQENNTPIKNKFDSELIKKWELEIGKRYKYKQLIFLHKKGKINLFEINEKVKYFEGCKSSL